MLSQSERVLEDASAKDQNDGVLEGEDEEEKVVVVEELADFEEIVVWGHEARPDDLADPYVRGVEEWISFAEQVSDDLGRSSTCTMYTDA